MPNNLEPRRVSKSICSDESHRYISNISMLNEAILDLHTFRPIGCAHDRRIRNSATK